MARKLLSRLGSGGAGIFTRSRSARIGKVISPSSASGVPATTASYVLDVSFRSNSAPSAAARSRWGDAAEIGAKVSRLAVAEGAAFKAGQALVSFDCTLQQAQLRKAQAELQGAEQTLKSNQRLAELNVGNYVPSRGKADPRACDQASRNGNFWGPWLP